MSSVFIFVVYFFLQVWAITYRIFGLFAKINPRKIFEKWLLTKINPREINFKNSSAMLEIGMGNSKSTCFRIFPILTLFLSFFANFKQWKKYIIKQWLFTFRQTAPSRNAFDAFMDQNQSNI